MIWSEAELAARAAFVLTWGLLNFFWLVLLRRPLTAAALSLALIVILILLSQFKHGVLMMTATFVDVMIIDVATFSFLLAIIPGLAWKVGLAVVLAIPVLLLLWRLEPFRVRRSIAVLGCLGCFGALAALSFALPTDREDEFYPHQYVSKFARSAAVAAVDLIAARRAGGRRCGSGPAEPGQWRRVRCRPQAAAHRHGVRRIELRRHHAAGRQGSAELPGPVPLVRRQAALVRGRGRRRPELVHRVQRAHRTVGALLRPLCRVRHPARRRPGQARTAPCVAECGYKTYSLYSWFGGFVGARGFQTTTGIEHFLDAKHLGSGPADTDRFYYDHAARVIAQQRGNGPVFVFVYLAINHFPWNYRYRPDLMPDWVNPGNPFEIDEYLRRQEMSARDYANSGSGSAASFPDEQFLLVRFGDHQPHFAKRFLEPALDQAAVAQRILERDPRYFTTYYAIEGVNFRPLDLSSALDTLDAPYLPLVVLEGAGVPLDATFVEQKRILDRCRGLFYLCAGGAEARRFNRLLIDAGLIQGF